MDARANLAARRYRPWLLGLTLLTMAAIPVVSSQVDRPDLDPSARLALALVPVALFAALITVFVLAARELDELQRKIQLEALAIAFPAAGALGMGVEYLQKAGFLLDWTIGDVWPFMFLLYAPAWLAAWWRYR